ncbi:ligase-associated DNA damage response exonuclease [soil metagenome]
MSENTPLKSTSTGFIVDQTDIWIDPREPVNCAIISHAHGDHAVPGSNIVYCTPNTAKLLYTRFRKFAQQVITPKYHEPFVVEGITFKFVPAGHMLGSAQIVWERNGKTIVYTGDFKRQFNPTCEAFETAPCDIFITESTFAQPEKTHPSPEESIRQLSTYKDLNFIIGAYSLGKAQRITYLLNEYAPELRVMIHSKIVPYHKNYEEAGFLKAKWEPFQKQVFKKERGIVYIVAPGVLQGQKASPDYLRGMASGWEHLQTGYELMFPISDHADWFDLIRTIEESGAKQVYTIHGDGKLLKDHLSVSGLKIDEL